MNAAHHMCRAIAESGEKSLGALPGEMAEKINPYTDAYMNEKLDELLVHKKKKKKKPWVNFSADTPDIMPDFSPLSTIAYGHM